MRKHTFRPSLNDVLEDRLALSHTGAAGVVQVAHPKPHKPGTPVLKSATLNDVNRKIDLAFTQFNKAYTKEVTQVDRTGNQAKFQSDLSANEIKLKAALDKQAARIPGGSQTLAQTLNARSTASSRTSRRTRPCPRPTWSGPTSRAPTRTWPPTSTTRCRRATSR